MITVSRLARSEHRQKISRRTVAAAFAFGVLLNAFAVVEPSRPALRNFDVRQKEVVLRVPAERREAAAKLRERLPQAQIDFHEITGSPKRVAATDGFLTGPNGIGRAVSEGSARGFGADDAHRATKALLNVSEH